MVFVTEPSPGCPHYEEFVSLPIQVSGSCFGTCAVNTRVSYLCDESSSALVGYATCMDDYTWNHSPLLATCPPAGEQNLQINNR